MKPEVTQQILPIGLLVAAIVCGGLSWILHGTALLVMLGVTVVLVIAGVFVAMRTEAARRK